MLIELFIGLAVIALVLLKWEQIDKFIRNVRDKLLGIRKLTSNDKVFTYMKQDYESGKYETVYGMFNDAKDELIEAERVRSNNVDDTIRQTHRRSALVIHE